MIRLAPVALAIVALSFLAFEWRTALASCLLGCMMLAITATDAHRQIIPDALSLPAIPIGLLASGYLVDPTHADLLDVDHVLGMVAGGMSLWLLRTAHFRLRGQEGMGLGDVKLAAAAGAWNGWQPLSIIFGLAGAAALTYVLAVVVWRRRDVSRASRVPFGAFLAPAIWLVWAATNFTRPQ